MGSRATNSQKRRSRSTRHPSGLPPMMAAFTAPMEEPTSQSGWASPASSSAA